MDRRHPVETTPRVGHGRDHDTPPLARSHKACSALQSPKSWFDPVWDLDRTRRALLRQYYDIDGKTTVHPSRPESLRPSAAPLPVPTSECEKPAVARFSGQFLAIGPTRAPVLPITPADQCSWRVFTCG